MVSKIPALCSILLYPVLVSTGANHVHAFVGAGVDHRHLIDTKTRQSTQLHPHRFHGGYDPSSPLTWTPQQAADFTIFHEGLPQHAGMQLRNTIQHWSGADLAEFLTRIYLGQTETDTTNSDCAYNNKKKIVYEPKNVRAPKWEGLDTREGIFALKDLLKEALSKEALSGQEISRFAEVFLLKEYKWPSRIPLLNSTLITPLPLSNSPPAKVVFEQDSFYSLGHARTIARVLLAVRKERGYNEFNWNDIALMVTLPERSDEDCEVIPMKLIDFFRTIAAYTTLTASDKANIVQRMAISGWQSGSIPTFMAKLIPAEALNENHSVDEIWKLQGDAFFDFPTAATVVETNAKQEKRKTFSIPVAKAKAKVEAKAKAKATVKVKDDEVESSQKPLGMKDTVPSEYEDLVQSYWKKVEVSSTRKKKQVDEGYGVPKTKSIKKRKIPDKISLVPKTKDVVDSASRKVPVEKVSRKAIAEKVSRKAVVERVSGNAVAEKVSTKAVVEKVPGKAVVEKVSTKATSKKAVSKRKTVVDSVSP